MTNEGVLLIKLDDYSLFTLISFFFPFILSFCERKLNEVLPSIRHFETIGVGTSTYTRINILSKFSPSLLFYYYYYYEQYYFTNKSKGWNFVIFPDIASKKIFHRHQWWRGKIMKPSEQQKICNSSKKENSSTAELR